MRTEHQKRRSYRKWLKVHRNQAFSSPKDWPNDVAAHFTWYCMGRFGPEPHVDWASAHHPRSSEKTNANRVRAYRNFLKRNHDGRTSSWWKGFLFDVYWPDDLTCHFKWYATGRQEPTLAVDWSKVNSLPALGQRHRKKHKKNIATWSKEQTPPDIDMSSSSSSSSSSSIVIPKMTVARKAPKRR